MIIVEETTPSLRISTSRKWDFRFLEVAKLISTWSKDPSTKVGAIAVNKHRRILAQGYNGFPAGFSDSESYYNNREIKYHNIIHAESNIVYNACNFRVSLRNSTVFVFGMYPCSECIKGLSQVGIVRVVFQVDVSDNLEKWKVDFDISKQIMKQLAIGFTHYKEK